MFNRILQPKIYPQIFPNVERISGVSVLPLPDLRNDQKGRGNGSSGFVLKYKIIEVKKSNGHLNFPFYSLPSVFCLERGGAKANITIQGMDFSILLKSIKVIQSKSPLKNSLGKKCMTNYNFYILNPHQLAFDQIL